MQRYSRLTTTEHRKNIKKVYLYVFLSITTLVIMIIFGLPLLVRFVGFIGNIKSPDSSLNIADTTPPAPPQFDLIPEHTNNESLEVKGRSESGATILIRANNQQAEVLTDQEGNFTYIFKLKLGENTIDAKAKDSSNNESTQSRTYKIVYDNKAPEITISTPSDNTSYYGNSQRQLVIRGSVNEPDATLLINGRFVSIDSEGNFTFSTTLQEGDNTFDVKATDKAGNESEYSFLVYFAS